MQAILLDPALGAQTMFIGGVNGGIWRTTNGGASWKALTDNQASLSIASLAFDPTRCHREDLDRRHRHHLERRLEQLQCRRRVRTRRRAHRTALLDRRRRHMVGAGRCLAHRPERDRGGGGGTPFWRRPSRNRSDADHRGNRSRTACTAAPTADRASASSQVGGLPAGPVTALVADPQNSGNCGTQNSCTFYAIGHLAGAPHRPPASTSRIIPDRTGRRCSPAPPA